jgi:osmoprotectant transport system ATP-binding protein
MIELLHLEKRYADPQTGAEVIAVQDLSVTFPTGKITCLLGPSGCGKTTTLKMINRLIEPSSGSIRLSGQDVLSLRPEVLRRRMGYVIQQIGLFPHFSVAQNIAVVPELLRYPKGQIQARVLELLELVGLEPKLFANKRPSELSGGQAQRVGVARALAADPPVLLMDEPFGALDPLARDKLQERFLEIQRRLQKTVVMVTHDIDEALRMADFVLLLNNGQLEQFAIPQDMVRYPANPFVRQFFGEDAFLRLLAGLKASALARAGDATGLPRVSGSLDARSVLALMLRDRIQVVAVLDDSGAVLGILERRILEEAL